MPSGTSLLIIGMGMSNSSSSCFRKEWNQAFMVFTIMFPSSTVQSTVEKFPSCHSSWKISLKMPTPQTVKPPLSRLQWKPVILKWSRCWSQKVLITLLVMFTIIFCPKNQQRNKPANTQQLIPTNKLVMLSLLKILLSRTVQSRKHWDGQELDKLW